MIENKNEASRNLEKALQALEQAKQRVANEKKEQNEKKRKAENHHKIPHRLCSFSGKRRLFRSVCLLRAAPPSPFEHRISFCGCAFLRNAFYRLGR